MREDHSITWDWEYISYCHIDGKPSHRVEIKFTKMSFNVSHWSLYKPKEGLMLDALGEFETLEEAVDASKKWALERMKDRMTLAEAKQERNEYPFHHASKRLK